MSIELDLLSVLLDKDNYYSYKKYIAKGTVSREVAFILDLIKDYFTFNNEQQVTASELAAFGKLMNGKYDSKHQAILDRLDVYTPSGQADAIMNRWIVRDTNEYLLAAIVDDKSEASLDKLSGIIDKARDMTGATTLSDMYITDDFEELVDTTVASGGYEWRIPYMNTTIGRVREGDLVVVGARPETGKTSFVASEVTYLLEQMDDEDECIVFNNEEAGRKLAMRLREAGLGTSSLAMMTDVPKYKAMYDSKFGKRMHVVHNTQLSTQQCESVLKNHPKAKIIVFNVLPKVQSKGGNSEVERQHQLFIWARELADKHDAIVVAVIQADGTAEGQKFLNMSQLYYSKTGVQSEADLLILIGKSGDESDDPRLRYITAAKNKLPPTSDTDPENRHPKFEATFDALTGRYS